MRGLSQHKHLLVLVRVLNKPSSYIAIRALCFDSWSALGLQLSTSFHDHTTKEDLPTRQRPPTSAVEQRHHHTSFIASLSSMVERTMHALNSRYIYGKVVRSFPPCAARFGWCVFGGSSAKPEALCAQRTSNSLHTIPLELHPSPTDILYLYTTTASPTRRHIPY